jgi:hypothetical protein
MAQLAQFAFIALMLMFPALAVAGPAEDANAVIDRWSAAYSSNDPETIAKNYCADAILLGTVSPVISEGDSSNRNVFYAYKRKREQKRNRRTTHNQHRR